jgi:uncharacterized membrane protein
MQASILIPIISFIALVVKEVFHIEIDANQQTVIVNGIVAVGLAVVTVLGIIKKHQSKKLTNLQ